MHFPCTPYDSEKRIRRELYVPARSVTRDAKTEQCRVTVLVNESHTYRGRLHKQSLKEDISRDW